VQNRMEEVMMRKTKRRTQVATYNILYTDKGKAVLCVEPVKKGDSVLYLLLSLLLHQRKGASGAMSQWLDKSGVSHQNK
jgi:hypothetical protein